MGVQEVTNSSAGFDDTVSVCCSNVVHGDLKFQVGLDEDNCASLAGPRQSSMCSQEVDVCK